MNVEILNNEVLNKDLGDYILEYLDQEGAENETIAKVYFGENFYTRKSIHFRSIGIHLISASISKSKPYFFEKLNGIVRAEGKYKIENENGWIGKGFIVDVLFSVEIDQASSTFRNLKFRSR